MELKQGRGVCPSCGTRQQRAPPEKPCLTSSHSEDLAVNGSAKVEIFSLEQCSTSFSRTTYDFTNKTNQLTKRLQTGFSLDTPQVPTNPALPTPTSDNNDLTQNVVKIRQSIFSGVFMNFKD